MRSRLAPMILVLALAALAATASPASAQELDWGECPEAGTEPLQCALLTVPRDYADPSGETIEIAVSRLPAEDPAERRGVLLSNPGGPGERGLFDPLRIGYSPEVRARYDLIGFDPRGIGYSAPVTCDLAPDDLDVLRFLPYPDEEAGIGENVAYSQRAAAGCAASVTAALLPHITTANTAADMDMIRSALGERRINYYGTSYGTYLGAVYEELYPRRTDRFILDGVVHPRRIWRSTFYSWGPAAEVALVPFYRYAAHNDATYGLGDTSAEVRAKGLELLAEIEEEPFDHPQAGPVDHKLWRETIRGALRNDISFPGLAGLWQLVDQGTAGPARIARSARAIERALDATGPQAPAGAAVTAADFPVPAPDNPYTSPWAVVCGDADWPESPATYEHDVGVADRLFPYIGGMAANIWPCAFWAFDPRDPVVDIGTQEGGKTLIVSSLFDPATPHDGAIAMRATLGSRSRLVSVETGGHVMAFNGRNGCAAAAASAFLADGTLPERDVFCPAEP